MFGAAAKTIFWMVSPSSSYGSKPIPFIEYNLRRNVLQAPSINVTNGLYQKNFPAKIRCKLGFLAAEKSDFKSQAVMKILERYFSTWNTSGIAWRMK
jgi:hypothetical protein